MVEGEAMHDGFCSSSDESPVYPTNISGIDIGDVAVCKHHHQDGEIVTADGVKSPH